MSAGSAIVAARDPALRRARLKTLAAQGIQGHPASTGTEILALTAVEAPDLVILDVELAGEDGAEICRRLKSNESFTPSVVLFLPASLTGFRKQTALESGADAYLSEPAEPEALTALARALLRTSQTSRELRQATERIEKLEWQLGQARVEVEQFASHACHDVEESLRGITTWAQLIDERHAGDLTVNERGYLGHVLASGNAVRRLLRGFLTYCRIGRVPSENFGPVELRIAAASALQSLSRRVEETKATIQLEGTLPTVRGDLGELQQVFEQLIANAIEYCRGPSTPYIRIWAQPGERQQHTIVVADNGPGVPPDRQTTIFLPFKRLHGREIPGAGLGLAIAKKIVELHEGRMWVESEAGSGCRFCFTLPAFAENQA